MTNLASRFTKTIARWSIPPATEEILHGRISQRRGADDGRFEQWNDEVVIDGHSKESWADADVSLGFKDEVSDHGTPGTLNALQRNRCHENT